MDVRNHRWYMAGLQPTYIVGNQMWTEVARGEEVEDPGGDSKEVEPASRGSDTVDVRSCLKE